MKPYPKYKESGVEWIGGVPEHWSALRLKWVCNFLYGESLSAQEREDGIIPVYGSNGIVGYHNRSITEKPCIIVGRKGSFGKVTFSEKKCYPIDTTYYIDCTSTKNYMRWLWYLLPLLKMDEFSRDSAVPGLNREDAYRNIVTLPSSYEQQQIAAYLDRKTTQIDKLMSKKQKFIELLKEERSAIINQAVTKGLNPDALMKDSGIEWLGEVPAHWEVNRLKYVAEINPSKSAYIEFRESDELITFLPMEKVSEKGRIQTDIKKPISELWNGFTCFEENDVIIAKITPCFENGKAALITNLGSNIGFGSTEFHVIRPRCLPKEYLFYITRTDLFMKFGEALMTGAAGQKRVPNEFIENYFVCYPKDKNEQNEISSFIHQKITKIDQTITKIEKQIDLLKEFRTALISEAVTGKIDVRDEESNG